jgi:hypothetical protein
MALAKCEDCGHQVSTEAMACPNCGRPMRAAPVAAANQSLPSPEPTAAQSPVPIRAQPPTPKKKNWLRRHKILSVILGLVLLIVIIAAAASGSSNKNANGSSGGSPTTPAQTPTTTPSSKPSKPKPSLTGPQQQAVESAQNYLSEGLGFSRAGLIQQLSSSYGEGFPKAVAVFAVNHLNVNWDQQAVESAKSYKQTGSGFSCSGMIQQLSSSAGSGFTHAQAVYGAKQVGVC